MEVQVIDEGPKVTNTKVGQIIRILEEDEDGTKSYVEYKVIKVYPYQVLAMANRGIKRRCIGYGDLVRMGLEYQSQESIIIKPQDGRKGARHTFDRTAQYA